MTTTQAAPKPLYEVIPSRCWKHTSGASASLYGAVPWTRDADKASWEVVQVGFTVRNTESGIVGIGRKPSETAEEAQVIADYLNSLRQPRPAPAAPAKPAKASRRPRSRRS